MLGGAVLVAAFLLFTAAAGRRASGGTAGAMLLRTGAWLLAVIGAFIVVSSSVIVIDAGQVGVRHAFGEVDPQPLLPGVRFITPWSNVERFSSREEQFPERSAQAETDQRALQRADGHAGGRGGPLADRPDAGAQHLPRAGRTGADPERGAERDP